MGEKDFNFFLAHIKLTSLKIYIMCCTRATVALVARLTIAIHFLVALVAREDISPQAKGCFL